MNLCRIIYLKSNYLYYKNSDNLLKLTFNDDIIYIVDKNIFIKEYVNFLKKHKISTFFINKDITIIYDSLLSKHDINYLSSIFYEIGYRTVILKSDVFLLNITKKDAYYLPGYKSKLLLRDKYNKIETIVFYNNVLTNNEINSIIKNKVKNKELLVIGNCSEEIFKNTNYYLSDNEPTFFINALLDIID